MTRAEKLTKVRRLITGGRIRKEADRRGLSLAEVARRAGISTQAIWAWQDGKRTPSVDATIRVGLALGLIASGEELADDFRRRIARLEEML
jgi:transcriptional regulator with XRE-family HTH domain